MTHLSCQSCDCGNYRNCKLRPPRELTSRERFFGFGIVALWLLIVALSFGDAKAARSKFGNEMLRYTEPLYVVEDADTGCQYLALHNVITPRMGRDGKQICREVAR